MRRTRRQQRRSARRQRTITVAAVFASVTPLAETLRAEVRRARREFDSASGEQALEGAAFLAERLGERQVRNLLLAARRHPARCELLLAMAEARLSAVPHVDRQADGGSDPTGA